MYQGCQIAFFDTKFHKSNFAFFRGSWRQKILYGFLAYSFQYLAFFGGSWHSYQTGILAFQYLVVEKFY